MGKRKFNVSMDIINVKKHKSNFDDISEDNYKDIREKAYELYEECVAYSAFPVSDSKKEMRND